MALISRHYSLIGYYVMKSVQGNIRNMSKRCSIIVFVFPVISVSLITTSSNVMAQE